ncbi:MAG: type II toxin-antitoxin system ParD family antitoxin [Moorea sp. SIO2B7]|nr:type II toxin-antitoxin system ParD family antitoxin [Moorena sp. SIO2B7]
MDVTLKPELREFIEDKIAQGQYQSLDDAINKGLELLRNHDNIYRGRFAELQQEIIIGVEAAERGELIDGDVVFEQLQRKLEQRSIQDNHG